MEIINLKINDIKPYKNNAKLHPREQIEHIANSIKAFGMNDPIGIATDENIIVTGHGRYLACKQLKYTEIPCIRLDHLTDEERRAYMLAHNQTNIETGFDFDILNLELDNIFEISMADFGFLDEPKEIEPVEDDFDVDANIPDEPVAKLGDIWQLGRHRLMCGDSLNYETVNKLMDGKIADIVVTDPPYFSFGSSSGAKSSNSDMGMVKPFFENLIRIISNNLKERNGAFICCDWRTYPLFYEIVNKYMNVRNCIVWDTEMLKMGVYFRSMHEFIIYATNDNTDEKSIGSFSAKKQNDLLQPKKDISNVWRVRDNNFASSNKLHSSEKPIELITKAIDSFIETQNNILDLFGGSGTTLMACEQLKRTCYMMELDPKYVDVIIARYEQFTGDKAILLNKEQE